MPEAERSPAFEAPGCIYCSGRGKAGRTGLFEMLSVSEAIALLISNNAEESALLELAKKEGCRTLAEDALLKIQRGVVMASDAQAAVAAW